MASTVGFFHNGRKAAFQKHFAAFVTRLHRQIEEDDVTIIERWAGDDPSRSLGDHVAELAQGGLGVMVAAGGPPSAQAAKIIATRIPVVFTSVANPKGLELVKDLERPDANMTGIAGLTSELDAKRLEILREYLGATGAQQVGVLKSRGRPLLDEQFTALKAAANALNFQLVDEEAGNLAEIHAKIGALKRAGVKGLLITADSLFNDRRREVVKAAKGIPAIYQWREFPEAGGLMSFGPDIIDAYERVADYVALILEGVPVSELPVSLPDRLDLVVNMKAAQEDGFRIPASILSRAQFVRPRLRPLRRDGASAQ